MELRPRRRATIVDVAREAGVATSTVSRAFTRPGRVNAATREHVLAVAARLGYAPNPAARAVKAGRTGTLGLLVPDVANLYFAPVIKGAEREAARSGLSLVIGDTQESPVVEEQLLRRLGPAVDGFVVAAPRGPDAALLAAAELNRLVLINRALPGITAVIADYDHGTRQIVAHLAGLGHRSVLFLGGPPGSWSGARRWAGLGAAAAESGLAVTRTGPYLPVLASGPAAADAVLARLADRRATAVVAHNDLLAIGLLRQLAARGVQVPGDVSVVGFDNAFGSDFCTPPLTTLAERTEQAGGRAIAMLTRQPAVGTRDVPVLVLPTTLVIRDSTGPAPSP